MINNIPNGKNQQLWLLLPAEQSKIYGIVQRSVYKRQKEGSKEKSKTMKREMIGRLLSLHFHQCGNQILSISENQKDKECPPYPIKRSREGVEWEINGALSSNNFSQITIVFCQLHM